jgi:hypothetical protein
LSCIVLENSDENLETERYYTINSRSEAKKEIDPLEVLLFDREKYKTILVDGFVLFGFFLLKTKEKKKSLIVDCKRCFLL